MDERNLTELRDMDDYLKQLIVRHWDIAIQSTVEGNIRKAFLSYKGLFSIVEPYDFGSKEFLKELTNVIQEHLVGLEGKPMTELDKIVFYKRDTTVRELLSIYQSEIPKAYSELNLWLKTHVKYGDVEEKISVENFGDKNTNFKKYKSELVKNLDLKGALEIMPRNQVLYLYGRWRLQKYGIQD